MKNIVKAQPQFQNFFLLKFYIAKADKNKQYIYNKLMQGAGNQVKQVK